MHDMTIDRTTNGTGWVQDMTLEQLRSYRIDTGPNIDNLSDGDKVVPTLAEFLQICNDNKLFPIIELRQRNYPAAAYLSLLSTISKYRDINDCVLMSFGIDVVKRLRGLSSTATIWYVTNDLSDNVLTECVNHNLGVDVDQRTETLTPERVATFKTNGVSVGTWTVYRSDDYDIPLSNNVDYITTAVNQLPE